MSHHDTIDLERLERDSAGPGKFEGEPPETLHYWERCMDGDGESLWSCEHGGGSWTLLETTEEERSVFGDDRPYFLLEEDSQGFVTGSFLAEDELERIRLEAEEGSGPAPEDYVIRSDGFRLNVGQVEGPFLGTFSGEGDEERARAAIREHAGGSFFPNVWTESDHGNLSLERGFRWDEGVSR